ncbi:MAG: DUF1801 domain-containing protein [Paludibacter sp.]|nr:DUF1801 domain-containing protein [Paludibacter sp.]
MPLLKHKTLINSVTDYLNMLPDNVYLPLENIRQIIKSLVPDAEETMKYMIPVYKHKGLLVGYGATKNQCSFFVFSSSVLKDFEEDIKGFKTTKLSIRFTQDNPIPNELITRIVMARVAENELKVITRRKTNALSRHKVLH